MFRSDLINQPIELEYLGWRTDTTILGRYGWRIAASRDLYAQAVRLYSRHDAAGFEFQSHPIPEMEFERAAYGGRIRTSICVMGKEIKMTGTLDPGLSDARFIETEPAYAPRWQEQTLEVIPGFKEADSGLLIPEDTVPDLLARIQELQEPARQERLKAQLRERRNAEPVVRARAKIITLGAA